ncbi:hypothetical protein PM082_019799 [Marasmius tenuissimus]|nr:hypothetical protein PM082_019799 [Marasmius tenuissimus]
MSTTAVPSEYTLLLDAHQVVVYPQVTLLTVYLLYGVYILLFGLCVHILRYGPIFHYRKLYLTSTILLFFLSSTTVAVETITMLQQSIVKFDAVNTQEYSGLIQYIQRDAYIRNKAFRLYGG